MASLTSGLQHQAIRKPENWTSPKRFYRPADHVLVLKYQVHMMQKDVKGGQLLADTELVYLRKDPHGPRLRPALTPTHHPE